MSERVVSLQPMSSIKRLDGADEVAGASMKSDDRARIGATVGTVGIGLGIISVGLVVASPSGSIWPAILGGVAIVVSLGTFYRLRNERGESEQ